jgi:hypothetical protein
MWAATRRLTSCFQAGKKVAVLADLLKAHFSLPPRRILPAGSRCRFHSTWARDLNGTARGIAFEPRKKIADKYSRHREILPRLRGIDPSFF